MPLNIDNMSFKKIFIYTKFHVKIKIKQIIHLKIPV